MSSILTQPLEGPGVWRGVDIAHEREWCHRLGDTELVSLDQALAHVHASGLKFPYFNRQDFPLSGMRERLAWIAEYLENGRGFALLQGLPVDQYSEEDMRIIYYGIGLHLGNPVSQNRRGDLLGVVMNVGDPNDKQTRVYETNAYLPYHTDPSDVVGLLCLRKAQAGGLSSLISMASVYNRMLASHSEYLGLFYRQVYYAHLGEDLPTRTPLFSFHDGKLASRYLRQYIEFGHEEMNLPLSRVEVEALDCFDQICQQEDLRLDMMLEPGDLQFANNYMVLHSRTRFDDAHRETARRKMLRLWLQMPNARALAPDFPGRNGIPPAPHSVNTHHSEGT